MNRFLTIITAATGIAVATASLACGDKLAAIGGGIRFERVYAARHPGRIALFVPQQSLLRAASQELRLAEALKRAGHQVIVIDDYQDLPQRLQPDRVDLLLVDVADARSLAASAAVAPRTVLLQTATAGRKAGTEPAPSKCVMALSRRTSLQLLRRIDEVLDSQQHGRVADCPADPTSVGA